MNKNGKLKQAWADMKQRCNNPNVASYKYYGLRGITYCKEWEHFENFRRWALNNGFSEGLSIDRIDPNGNYEPKNCRWATREVQDNNRRDSIHEVVNGKRMTLKQIANTYGISYSTIQHRYNVGDRGNKLIEPLNQGVRRDGNKINRKQFKFSNQELAEAKWLSKNTDLRQKDIAELYGMSQTFVGKLKLGHVHKGLKGVQPEWFEKKINTMQR